MQSLTVLVAHPSADLYGSDRVVIDTVRALQEAGHRVVFTVPTDGPLLENIEALGVSVALCPSPVLRKSALKPRGFVQLVTTTARATPAGRKLLHDHAVDAVFVNTVTIPWWLIIARLADGRRPTLVHVHEAERSAARRLRRLLAAPLLLADRVIANSRFSRDTVIDVWPRLARKIDVVANPVPGPAEFAPPRPALDGPTRLLFVGRLSPRKGPDVAIAAVAELVRDGVDVTLDLVGAVFPGYEWFEERLRQQIAAYRLERRVRLVGFDSDVWSRLAAADVALVPSTVDEPFGNTAVEAMLAGRPAIVSATSGLLEAAADYQSVRYVAPSNARELAAAVVEIRTEWSHFRDAAVADAAVAQARHDPAAYRRRLAELVAAMSGAK